MCLHSSLDVIMILSKGINNSLFKHPVTRKNWNQVGFTPMFLTGGLEVKVHTQNVRDVGLNPTWFHFFPVIGCLNKLLFIPLLNIIITSRELCKHTEVFLYINRLLDGSQG